MRITASEKEYRLMTLIIEIDMKHIIKILILLLVLSLQTQAQFKNVSVSAGLVTTSILGDNPGTWPIVERDVNINRDIGGSFRGSQPGFGIRFNFPVSKYPNLNIPIGFDYIYYHALEKVPITQKSTLFLRHTVAVPTATMGVNYFLFKFPVANVKAYTGIEARGSFVQEGNFYRRFEFELQDSIKIIDTKSKDAGFRLGALLKFGVEGEFISPWYVNTGIAFGAVNLIGRDNERGELLTPMKSFETSESIVYNMHLFFMIQYKFN